MASRAKQFQIDIETEEDFLREVASRGTVIAELYVKWAGPATPLDGFFRNFTLEFDQAPLKFLRVATDAIPCLWRFRGHCEPQILFFRDAALVQTVRGIQTPVLTTAVRQYVGKNEPLPEDLSSLPPLIPFDPIEEWGAEPAGPLGALGVRSAPSGSAEAPPQEADATELEGADSDLVGAAGEGEAEETEAKPDADNAPEVDAGVAAAAEESSSEHD
jgi:hypothetical protein